MYPKGGEIQGFLEAARNFQTSGFMIRAREAAERGRKAAEKLAKRRPLSQAETEALEATEGLLAHLDETAGVEPEVAS